MPNKSSKLVVVWRYKEETKFNRKSIIHMNLCPIQYFKHQNPIYEYFITNINIFKK